ncbi:adenylate/guanylate cyclase domain-containing protein [Desulfogranum mediterraneum]|uniref:adenylate/guanylate cyclase domain-containing protein n=1 Tax=Desulfogranum mediterraneum TaxID=160661 RepID=UPI00048D3A08|nr:adenylate/guanylate cyclase domain-containing protein [Desulfogranum mediterraneum]
MTANQERILVVEDSVINQKILERLLTQQGYAVSLAGDADQALAHLHQNRTTLPELIVLDIMMPGMDGYTLCTLLKKNEQFRDIPVVFISSLDRAANKVRGFEVGGVDYITKPFHSAEVLARIHTHLKLCRLQRQLEEKNRQLQLEKQRSEGLLLNVLPARVAQELIATGSFSPQLYTNVSVCFIDIVQFTAAASLLRPDILIEELNQIFSGFDAIAREHGCERMKTVGDAFLCTCGIPEADPRHAHKMADTALAIIAFMEERNQRAAHKWQVRIGMHCGDVVGGIVGTDKYLYDIFGDTVNVASRLESLSAPMKINVSAQVHETLAAEYRFSKPLQVEMKGKGGRAMAFLLGPRSPEESVAA